MEGLGRLGRCNLQIRHSRVSRPLCRGSHGIAKANDTRHRAGLEIMLEDYLKQDTVSRNARLALLRWHSQLVKQDKDCQDKFLSVCSEYFSDHCSRVVCFRDLHPYLKHLERSKQEELCRLAANTARGNMARANESEVGIDDLFCRGIN